MLAHLVSLHSGESHLAATNEPTASSHRSTVYDGIVQGRVKLFMLDLLARYQHGLSTVYHLQGSVFLFCFVFSKLQTFYIDQKNGYKQSCTEIFSNSGFSIWIPLVSNSQLFSEYFRLPHPSWRSSLFFQGFLSFRFVTGSAGGVVSLMCCFCFDPFLQQDPRGHCEIPASSHHSQGLCNQTFSCLCASFSLTCVLGSSKPAS